MILLQKPLTRTPLTLREICERGKGLWRVLVAIYEMRDAMGSMVVQVNMGIVCVHARGSFQET